MFLEWTLNPLDGKKFKPEAIFVYFCVSRLILGGVRTNAQNIQMSYLLLQHKEVRVFLLQAWISEGLLSDWIYIKFLKSIENNNCTIVKYVKILYYICLKFLNSPSSLFSILLLLSNTLNKITNINKLFLRYAIYRLYPNTFTPNCCNFY